MMYSDIELIAASVLWLAVGVLVGMVIKPKAFRKPQAPTVPMAMGYDPRNPINQRGQRREEDDGWTLMSPERQWGTKE